MEDTTMSQSEIQSSRYSPSWKFIGILLVFSLCITWAFLFAQNSPTKTVDDKLSQLKELRNDKKLKEVALDDLKKQIYLLDQKIIPLKCSVYSEVGAKDTWESECRDSHEEQKQKILNQESEEVDEAVVPDYQ